MWIKATLARDGRIGYINLDHCIAAFADDHAGTQLILRVSAPDQDGASNAQWYHVMETFQELGLEALLDNQMNGS